MDYRIYCIESNNKRYIGQTRQKRDFGRINSRHDCFKLYDLDKDNWSYKILERCKSQEELDKRENYYITNLDCVNRQIGPIYKNKSRQEYYSDYYQRVRDKRIKEWKEKSTPEFKKNRNKRVREIRDYQSTWGGDMRYHNNLLSIDINLFK